MEICKQLRQFEVKSIAAGAETKIQECGDEATETVLVNEELHKMCARCAGDAVKEFDGVEIAKEREAAAVLLRQWGDEARGCAERSPKIATAYLTQVSLDLDAMALDVMEGRA